MCLIIAKKPGAVIPDEVLDWGWDLNPDGGGMAFIDQSQNLFIEKGFESYEKMHYALRWYEYQYPTSPFIVHFRLATSGRTDKTNCHPFPVHDDLAMVHNGIFSDYSHGLGDYSDTWWFNTDVLQTLPKDFLKNAATRYLLNDYCVSSGNKLAFLTSTGEVWICNEEAGSWNADKDIWYSTQWVPGKQLLLTDGVNGNQTIQLTKDDTKDDVTDYTGSNTCIVCNVVYNDEVLDWVGGYRMCSWCESMIMNEPVKCSHCGIEATLDKRECTTCHKLYNVQEIVDTVLLGE